MDACRAFHGVLVKQTMKTITVRNYFSYAVSVFSSLVSFIAPVAMVAAIA